MKKSNFLSKFLVGISLLIAGTSQAQTSSGYTHAINFSQDCYVGYASWDADFSMSVYTGGHSNFRVETRLYRGDWTISGMGHVVNNDALISTSTSSVYYYFPFVVAGTPIVFTSANFYSTPLNFSKNRNGAYRMTTTLQKQIGGVWTDIYTTPLSPAYGVIDTPPYPTYGDFNELALVDELNTGGNFDYKINGVQQISTPPSFITCPAVDLVVDNVTDWQQNPGTATITVEKGTLAGSVFSPSSSSSTTFPVDGANKNLTSLFSLSSYSGALRITYKLPDDECYGSYTPVSKTMTISVTTATFLNDYKQRNGGLYCSQPLSKTMSNTWNITTTMPAAGANLSAFRCNIASTLGWAGATSVGITDLNFSGYNYSVDVYEVNATTGARGGSPSIYLNSGTASGTTDLSFNYSGNGAGFDPTASPYYVDGTADASGNNGTGNYFVDLYNAAFTPGSGITATNLSSRVFCVEVSQFPSSGCVVNQLTYFRIANNGAMNGKGARMNMSGTETTEGEYMSLDVYPNPTKGELMIPVSEEDTNVSLLIMDNLGKQVMSIEDVKAKAGVLNVENLSPGIYFYSINKDNTIYRGKIVKQ